MPMFCLCFCFTPAGALASGFWRVLQTPLCRFYGKPSVPINEKDDQRLFEAELFTALDELVYLHCLI